MARAGIGSPRGHDDQPGHPEPIEQWGQPGAPRDETETWRGWRLRAGGPSALWLVRLRSAVTRRQPRRERALASGPVDDGQAHRADLGPAEGSRDQRHRGAQLARLRSIFGTPNGAHRLTESVTELRKTPKAGGANSQNVQRLSGDFFTNAFGWSQGADTYALSGIVQTITDATGSMARKVALPGAWTSINAAGYTYSPSLDNVVAYVIGAGIDGQEWETWWAPGMPHWAAPIPISEAESFLGVTSPVTPGLLDHLWTEAQEREKAALAARQAAMSSMRRGGPRAIRPSVPGPSGPLQKFFLAGAPREVMHSYMKRQWVDDEAVAWAKESIEADEAQLWKALGLQPGEAGRLVKQGVSTVETMKRWWRAGIPLDEVGDWIGAGLRPEEASHQRAKGITAKQAAALRALRDDAGRSW